MPPSAQYRGHAFEHNVIGGGKVHFGDVNYYNSAKNAYETQSPIQAENRSSNANGSNELFLVPRCSTPQFTGRTLQSKMVHENLAAHRSPAMGDKHKIVVIYGLGGSGKTQFCLRYAESNRPCYWGVFWIDASTRENAEAGFAALGLQAGKGATYSAGKYWLSQCQEPWLLILDNADDPELDVSEFFPAGGNGHILLTTRNPNTIIYATAGHLQFRGMDPEEGVSLLLRSAYPQGISEDVGSQRHDLASSIAAELGYLAIALDHAGATIRRKIYTLERYLHFYLGHRNRLLSSSKQISADEADAITTWEIPFRRIEMRHSVQHLDAVTLIHTFAFLHYESISERIFRVAWTSGEDRPSLDLTSCDLLQLDSSHSAESQARLRQALGVLCDYSIIDHDADRETCSLHPVVHRWTRTRLSDKDQFAHWLDNTIELLVRCIYPNLEASGRTFRRTLLPHVDSCMELLKVLNPSFPHTKRGADQIERFACLYAETGLWKSALTLLQRVITFRTRILGKAHEDTLRAQRSLSQIYWNLFEVKLAIDVQVQIFHTRWRSRPSLASWACWPPWKPKHLAYFAALDDLTQTLWLAGLRTKSKQAGERAVKGFREKLGPDDPRTLNAIFNLARTYIHLGNFLQGHKLLITVLRKRKHFFGSDHPDTLMTRNELGMSFCRRKQRLAIAERLVANVFDARKRVLGEEHAYTLWSANDLSKVLCERGRQAEAARLLEDLVPVVARTLGENHVGMSMTKGNLARAYVRCERWDDADKLIGEVLSLTKDGEPDWIEAMHGQIHVQIHFGRLDEAERNCNRVLNKIAQTQMSTSDNPQAIAVAKQLKKIYTSIGRYDQIPILEAQFPAMSEG